jgi:hypothetical protein
MMKNIEKVKHLHPYHFPYSVAQKLCKYICFFLVGGMKILPETNKLSK